MRRLSIRSRSSSSRIGSVGAEVLGDHQVLPNLWLLPLRDVLHMGIWIAGYAGNTIVWRGEEFVLVRGKLENKSGG